MHLTQTMEHLDKQETKNEVDPSDFAQLLDDYQYVAPKRGQILQGEIKNKDEDIIILDVGLKRDAFVISREVKNLDEAEFEDLAVGDIIPIQVSRTPVGDENLLVSILEAQEYQAWEQAKILLEEREAVELEVIDQNRGGLIVQFDQLEGFVPNSHIPEIKRNHNPQKTRRRKSEMVGERLLVKPIEVDRDHQRLVFSQLQAHKERRQQRLAEIQVGEVYKGKVVNLVTFGAFVDLGGFDGLIHISELDYQRVSHPSRLLNLGDEVQVLVLEVDPERERIKLSRKALLQNPWELVAEQCAPGDLVEVEIVNVVDFGAFAALPQGVQGLIHISELGYTAPNDTQNLVHKGELVLVKILKIDPERERVSLSMRQVPMEKQIDWLLKSGEVDQGEVPERTGDVEISEEIADTDDLADVEE